MPIPGTANAPSFNGRYPRDFLSKIELHGRAAGIVDKDLLVDYIYDYSTDDTKAQIRYLPEFDREVIGKTWADAKTMLIALYGSSDAPPRVTEAQLTEFCADQSSKAPFANKKALENYYRNFLAIAAPLVKSSDITEKARDSKFVLGLPASLRDWVVERLPENNRVRSDPPKIPDVLKLLQTRYEPDSLLYNPATESDRPLLQVRFEEPSATNQLQAQTSFPASNSHLGKPETDLDRLVQRMSELKLNSAQALEFLSLLNSNPTSLTSTPQKTGRRCFICGEVDAHPLHPSKCPEMALLIRDKLVVFNQDRNRFVLPSGEDLPRTPMGYTGGVANYLCAQQTAQNTQQNTRQNWVPEIPPHLKSKEATTSSIRLVYGDQQVLEGKVYAVASNVREADPALRSGKDTSNRFDPKKREADQKGKSVTDPQNASDSVPKKTTTQVPPPTNPINRSDGWKESLHKPVRSEPEVEMKDGTKKSTPQNSQYHFTSDIQERADPQIVYEEIMNQRVTLPIYQVVGSSPALQKLIGEATRTKRVYNSKKAEYSYQGDQETIMEHIDITGNVSVIPIATGLEAADFTQIEHFLVNYANALVRTDKFLAMTVGKLQVSINAVSFLAMVDTGSELNVADPSFPQRSNLAVDFEGMKWSLRGIHGNPEQLQGVVTDAPIKMGSHLFPHHLFVSNHPLGEHDIILGQPFLHWYSARIDYNRNAPTKLILWKNGDRDEPPTISITITDPTDPRNTSKFTHQAAYIEDVEEDGEPITGFQN